MNLFAGVSWTSFLMRAVPIFILVQVGLIFLYKFVWKDKEGVESKEKQRLSMEKEEDEQEEPVVLNQNVIMAGDDEEDEVKPSRDKDMSEADLQQKLAMAEAPKDAGDDDADDGSLSDQTADSSDWDATEDPNDNADDEMEENFRKSVACQSVETQEADGWGEELVIKGLGAMEKQAIAESGDGDTVVIGAEKVADMEQQSGKASERGFDFNSVDVAEDYKPVSMLNKLQEMQAQEDLKAMESSEVDVDVEDIPAAPKQVEEDDDDEGPEQKDKDI